MPPVFHPAGIPAPAPSCLLHQATAPVPAPNRLRHPEYQKSPSALQLPLTPDCFAGRCRPAYSDFRTFRPALPLLTPIQFLLPRLFFPLPVPILLSFDWILPSGWPHPPPGILPLTFRPIPLPPVRSPQSPRHVLKRIPVYRSVFPQRASDGPLPENC